MKTIEIKSGSGPDTIWFEKFAARRDPALRLLCFPYAGGSEHIFRSWRWHFPAPVELWVARLPGRGMRLGEKPFTRLTSLVQAIADQWEDQVKAQCAFYGHSMGATIAFELARELRKRSRPGPVQLFVSGHRAPHLVNSEPPTFSLPEAEFIGELKRLKGTPEELLENPETAALFLPTLRADFELIENYEYRKEPPLSCPINVYGGLSDADVPIANLAGWREHTTANFRLRMFAGDHFFIHRSAEFLEDLRRDIGACYQVRTIQMDTDAM